jgi:hypothetical protein
MSIVRNIDVTMQSEVSFDDACRLGTSPRTDHGDNPD